MESWVCARAQRKHIHICSMFECSGDKRNRGEN